MAPPPIVVVRAGAPSSAGFVLVLAGGGYGFRSEHEYLPVTRWLADAGVPCGYLDYAVAPETYPTPLVQVLAALRELRAGTYGPVHGPLVVLGFSAGAHLAGLALTATPAERELAASRPGSGVYDYARPDAAVLCYPVVSMTHLPHLGSRNNLLGELTGDTTTAKSLSVEQRVDGGTAPTFLWHTADDAVVDVDHSLRLTAALARHDVPAELHVYPSGSHGLGLARGTGAPAEWTDACLRWLGEQGVGPRPANASGEPPAHATEVGP